MVFRAVFGFVFTHLGSHQFFKQSPVFGRHCEMYVHFTCLSGCIQRTFYQMFFQRCTYAVGITVELKQSLRQGTVVQSCSFQQIGYNGFVVLFRQQSIDVLARIVHASRIQVVIECKVMDMVEELLLEIRRRFVIVRP